MGAMENRQAIDFAYTVLFSAIYDQAFRTSWMPIRTDFRPFSPIFRPLVQQCCTDGLNVVPKFAARRGK
jgi:hypothetical protein